MREIGFFERYACERDGECCGLEKKREKSALEFSRIVFPPKDNYSRGRRVLGSKLHTQVILDESVGWQRCYTAKT